MIIISIIIYYHTIIVFVHGCSGSGLNLKRRMVTITLPTVTVVVVVVRLFISFQRCLLR